MNGEAEACQFDEHQFFIDEYAKAVTEPYNFKFHDHQLVAYKQKLKQGKTVLFEQEQLKIKYEETLESLEKARKDKENQEKQSKECERQLNNIKEEWTESLFSWDKQNQTVRIEKSVLSRVAERVYQYGEPYRFDQIVEPARVAYEGIRNYINSEISHIRGTVKFKNQALDEIKTKLQAIRDQKEPEPNRDKKVVKNRERLQAQVIPYLPLYKAIDFSNNTDNALRGRIEEAFLELGILDAVIVAPQYRERVLEMDAGMADKYIFAQPELMTHNLSTYLQPDKQNDAIEFQLVDDVLQSIMLNQTSENFYITEQGSYGMGIVQGQTSGTYEAKFVGIESRKRYKEQLIAEIEQEIQKAQAEITALDRQIDEKNAILSHSDIEWRKFPKDDDLVVAYQQYSDSLALNRHYDQLTEKAQKNSETVYETLKQKEIEVHEKTRRIQLASRSDVYEQALVVLDEYQEKLQELKLSDKDQWHAKEGLMMARIQHEQCLDDLAILQDDRDRITHEIKQTTKRIETIETELSLSDYQDILDQIARCLKRLNAIPVEYKEKVNKHATVSAEMKQNKQVLDEKIATVDIVARRVALYEKGFLEEVSLGYVVEPNKELSSIEQAKAVEQMVGDVLQEKKQWMELRDDLQERLHREGGELAEYNLKRIDLFQELGQTEDSLPDEATIRLQMQRMDIVARMMGREVKFYELVQLVDSQIKENSTLLDEQDRLLFEDILIKSVSRKISGKIYHSEQWVKKIDALMRSMNTSSGLTFSLRWVTKQAEAEEQLSTKELVNMLKGEQSLLTPEQRERLINHFRSKIQMSKNRIEDDNEQRSFLAVMKDILDYRKWFEFQLSYTKEGEKTKELTNNAFFTFSGGEKAMAMYVPLFSAVYAKYQGGRPDCPKVISLDEAFAGVDEKNIQDMFRLLVELDLSFIANSQVLFGDYETVPDLGIVELIRPENMTVVTSIRYKWNGLVRQLVTEAS
jgi:hypothetical protein